MKPRFRAALFCAIAMVTIVGIAAADQTTEKKTNQTASSDERRTLSPKAADRDDVDDRINRWRRDRTRQMNTTFSDSPFGGATPRSTSLGGLAGSGEDLRDTGEDQENDLENDEDEENDLEDDEDEEDDLEDDEEDEGDEEDDVSPSSPR